jgi:hypothetical protein
MTRDEQFTALEKAAKTIDDIRVINKSSDSITIQFKNDDGSGTLCRYALFPGYLFKRHGHFLR